MRFKQFFKFGNYDWLGEYRTNSIISLCVQANPSLSEQIKQINPQIPLDVFHSCYLLNTTIQQEDQFLQQITEPILKDQELRKITVADDLISRFFSVKYVLRILEELDKEQKQKSDDSTIQQIVQMLQGYSHSDDDSQNPLEFHQVLQEVTEKAKERAKQETEIAKIYKGLKAGTGHTVTFGELLNLDFVVDIKKLYEIFKDIALEFTKAKAEELYGSFEGVKFGRDFRSLLLTAYMLPEELFWYRYATGTLPEIEIKTSEISEFTLVVDKSGSMNERNKTLWSRAIALALAKQAKKFNVNAKLIWFDERPFGLADLRKEFDKALDYILRLECDGGTSINKALEYADKEGIGTIVLITDGEDSVSYKPRRRLISVMVEGHNEELQKISDVYLKVQPDKSGILKLIQHIR